MTHKDNPKVDWGAKVMAECIGEELPPCQAACPLDIRVREKLRFMQQGDPAAALAVVLERCPFPGILGRICTHPCEAACTRNSLDQPIAVAGLKRYLADLDPDAVSDVPLDRTGPNRSPWWEAARPGSWRPTSCGAWDIRSPSLKPKLSWAGPCGSTSRPFACPGRCWSGR